MMTKLTSEMDPQEEVLILKSALTGECAKLVVNKQNYDQYDRDVTIFGI